MEKGTAGKRRYVTGLMEGAARTAKGKGLLWEKTTCCPAFRNWPGNGIMTRTGKFVRKVSCPSPALGSGGNAGTGTAGKRLSRAAQRGGQAVRIVRARLR